MDGKISVTIWQNDVSPRFDLTTEVLIVTLDSEGSIAGRKTMILPTVSAEDLCQLILAEGVTLVICGGIEEQYYQYLAWKKVKVIDSVIGPYERALEFALAGKLQAGSNLMK